MERIFTEAAGCWFTTLEIYTMVANEKKVVPFVPFLFPFFFFFFLIELWKNKPIFMGRSFEVIVCNILDETSGTLDRLKLTLG